MTPNDRIARADRAKAAMEEFFGPAFDHVETEWYEKLIHIAGQDDPNAEKRIMRITAAVKAIRIVRAQIEALVLDGRLAEQDMQRTAQLARMSDHKRSVVGV